MKLMLALLGTVFLSMNCYAHEPVWANCSCGEECDCTHENHCGCLSDHNDYIVMTDHTISKCKCGSDCKCGSGGGCGCGKR